MPTATAVCVITGIDDESHTGIAAVQFGSGGTHRAPLESAAWMISGLAFVGALVNSDESRFCEHEYDPAAMRHSSPSDNEKSNPVMMVDHEPDENNGARLAHDVPSASPLPVVSK